MTLNEIIMQLVLLEEHPAMPKGFQPTFHKVIEAISEMPEIIRCKDCKYHEECCRTIRSYGRSDDDFCSYAELRRDEAKEGGDKGC